MLDAVDVVMLRPPTGVPPVTVRRLATRARGSGAVLIPLGDWPEADLRLVLARSVWLGLEQGHGRLQTRQALVRVTGRGAAQAGRRAWLWLLDEQGRVRHLRRGELPGWHSLEDRSSSGAPQRRQCAQSVRQKGESAARLEGDA